MVYARALLLMALALFVNVQSHTTSRTAEFERAELYSTLASMGREAVHINNEFELLNPAAYTDASGEAERKLYSDTYTITSISPQTINNDEFVVVSYYSSYPSTGDWIGAYSPANVDHTTTVPVKYAWCDDDKNYLSTGKGQRIFNMTNLRADVSFKYFSDSLRYAKLRDTSTQNLTFSDFDEQLRPRVVATGDPDVFSLLWSSSSKTTLPELKWGLASNTYTHTISATTSSISRDSLCGGVAKSIGWRDMGSIHTAQLTGMLALANSDIYYTFGDSAAGGSWSKKEYVFHVPPVKGTNPPTRPTTIVMFDDLGRGSNDQAYTWYHYGEPSFNTTKSIGELVKNKMVDAVYHGGDISYAIGYEAVWDFFMDQLSPVASGTLYLSTVGNHESDWPNSASYFNVTDSGGECSVVATAMLPLPAPATLNKPWWSYDVGLVHLVGMSTEHNFTYGSEQYAWLEEDLRNVNRTATPWIVFGGHRAMYINSDWQGPQVFSDGKVSDLLIEHIEPLLFKYRVNLAFYGHDHCVQRQNAVLAKTVVQAADNRYDEQLGDHVAWHVDPQATVHMVIGTGGAKISYTTVFPYPSWTEKVMYLWGFTILKAHNATHLTWDWVNSANDTVMDRMVVTQNTQAAAASYLTSQNDSYSKWPCPPTLACSLAAMGSSTPTTRYGCPAATCSSTAPDSSKSLSTLAIALISTFSVLFFLSIVACFYLQYKRRAASLSASSTAKNEPGSASAHGPLFPPPSSRVRKGLVEASDGSVNNELEPEDENFRVEMSRSTDNGTKSPFTNLFPVGTTV